MKALIYSLNYNPELTGIGKYNTEMAEWLVEKGVNVEVLCAKPYYPQWQVHKNYKQGLIRHTLEQGVEISRCALYVPAKPTAVKRILHLLSFALISGLALFKGIFSNKQKPDLIFVVEPTLFIVPLALLYAKLIGAKTLLHIQDYEVDAMFGLGMGGSVGFIKKMAFSIESWFMRRFDKISTISLSMQNRAINKGVNKNKTLLFPNWADTAFVTPDIDGRTMRHKWNFSDTDKLVLYAGNIGAKQGLELVLQAAQSFKNDPHVKFIFVGSGAYVDELKSIADNLQLENVYFKPLQAWEDVPAMLAMADVHLVVQKKGAADAVLPSKLTNILSAGGNALVTAEKETELGLLAHKYPHIYECVEPESLTAFITGLTSLLNKPAGTNQIARQYAEKQLNKDAILNEFLINIQKFIS